MLALRVLVLLTFIFPCRSADLELTAADFGGAFPLQSAEAVLVPHEGGLDLVYTALVEKRAEIFWRRRGGTNSWGRAFQVSIPAVGTGANRPSALIDQSGRLQVVWLSREKGGLYAVRHRVRLRDGSWGKQHTFLVGGDRSFPQLLEDAGGRLYVYYRTIVREWRWGRIYVYVSEDGGASWRLSDPNYPDHLKDGYCDAPHMIIHGNTVTIIWIDQSPGGNAVVVNQSRDGGMTWQESPQVISADLRAYRHPKLVAQEDRIHAVWGLSGRDVKGAFQELYSSYTTGVGDWSRPELVYKARSWKLDIVLAGVGSRIAFAGVERRQLFPDRLVFKTFWRNNKYLDQEAEELWQGSRRSMLESLSVVASGNVMGVMFSERGDGQGGAHLHFRTYPELSWQHIELSKEAEKLNKERGDVDAMGPVGYLEPDERGIGFLFHLVKRRQFLEEPPQPNTQLVFGRMAIAP